jgi:uncharacterized membrane protein YgdD (TMEM256/DUF423 family)
VSKISKVVASALAALAVSVIAGFAHADRIVVAGTKIPYGLALALALCTLSVLWLNRYFETRLAGLVFLTVWVITTLQLAVESPTGDLVLSATWYSSVYVIAGAILISAAAVVPHQDAPTSNLDS